MSPADRDARIRALKRLVGLAGTELARARAEAPANWTGKCARASRSFGAYDRGRARVQRCRQAIEDLNRELAELQAHARRHQAAAENRGNRTATGPITFKIDGIAVEDLGPGRIRFCGGRRASRVTAGAVVFLESAAIGSVAATVDQIAGEILSVTAAD